MATNYSPQVLGEPYVTVIPTQEFDSHQSPSDRNNNNNNKNVPFFVHIKATLSSLPPENDDDDDETSIPSASRSATFTSSFHLPPGGGAARDAVVAALSDVHVVDEAAAGFVADQILRVNAPRVVAKVNVFVDQLPRDYDSDEDSDENEDDYDYDYDYEVRFVPASRESIEGLEKAVAEKAVTCTVCLDEIRVGSESTRLPCSHCYHMECIVEWLEKNKFCPSCRFEMP